MYQSPLEREFRRLGCVQIRIDTLVHGYVHHLYSLPKKVRKSAMKYVIDRHTQGLCGCFNLEERVKVNLLEIGRTEPLPASLIDLPCLVKDVDRIVLSMIERHYRKPGDLTVSDVRRLVARHHIQTCGCFNIQVTQDRVYARAS